MRRPERLVLMLSLTALAVCFGLLASRASAAHVSPGTWCGGQQWRLMNLSDPRRNRVRFDRVETTLPNIAHMRSPQLIGTERTTHFQVNTWRLHVVIDRYRIASNGEIVLVLYDLPCGLYMAAYLTTPHCLLPTHPHRNVMT